MSSPDFGVATEPMGFPDAPPVDAGEPSASASADPVIPVNPLVERLLSQLPLLDVYYQLQDLSTQLKADGKSHREYLDAVRQLIATHLAGVSLNYTQADEFNDQVMLRYLTKKKRVSEAIAIASGVTWPLSSDSTPSG